MPIICKGIAKFRVALHMSSLYYVIRSYIVIRLLENCQTQFRQVIEWKIKKITEVLIQVFVQHSDYKVIVVEMCSFGDKCLVVCSFTETVWDGRTVR